MIEREMFYLKDEKLVLCLVRIIRQSSSESGSYLGLAGGGLAPGGVGAGDDLGGATADPGGGKEAGAEAGGAGEAVLL